MTVLFTFKFISDIHNNKIFNNLFHDILVEINSITCYIIFNENIYVTFYINKKKYSVYYVGTELHVMNRELKPVRNSLKKIIQHQLIDDDIAEFIIIHIVELIQKLNNYSILKSEINQFLGQKLTYADLPPINISFEDYYIFIIKMKTKCVLTGYIHNILSENDEYLDNDYCKMLEYFGPFDEENFIILYKYILGKQYNDKKKIYVINNYSKIIRKLKKKITNYNNDD